jgi:diketogulonate reductase-like aldo/keto reductase
MKIPNLKMNNGKKIPQVGFGLWQVKDEKECKGSVKDALAAGYTHFDTAQAYGNEQFLGEVLRENKTKRDEVFITTKIWNANQYWNDLIPSFEESLKKLQMDYVDLLLLHFPVTELRRPAWRKMEEVHKDGRAKSIGVSNYTIGHLEELLKECSIKPAVNQVELHVFLQQPELVDYCKKNNIVVEAYSPLAHGYGMDDPVFAGIAKKYSKTPAQIMIRWCIEKGTVPLPKSVHKQRIEENLNIFDFELDGEDMAAILKLNRDIRTCWDPTNVP